MLDMWFWKRDGWKELCFIFIKLIYLHFLADSENKETFKLD